MAVYKRLILGYGALKSVVGASGSHCQNAKQGHLQIRYLASGQLSVITVLRIFRCLVSYNAQFVLEDGK